MEETDHETDPKKPAPRKRNPEESRRRILDAAEHAFALRGFGGARLRDIAQEAGVHHALVHHYYGDKRGLLQQVIERGLQRMAEAGREALSGPATLEAAVAAFVGLSFDFCVENRGLLRIIDDAFRNHELVSLDVTRSALATFSSSLLAKLKRTIESGQQNGVVRADISADSLIMLGFGAIVHRFDTAEGLLVAMGMPAPLELDLAREREHTIRYVLSAMSPPKT